MATGYVSQTAKEILGAVHEGLLAGLSDEVKASIVLTSAVYGDDSGGYVMVDVIDPRAAKVSEYNRRATALDLNVKRESRRSHWRQPEGWAAVTKYAGKTRFGTGRQEVKTIQTRKSGFPVDEAVALLLDFIPRHVDSVLYDAVHSAAVKALKEDLAGRGIPLGMLHYQDKVKVDYSVVSFFLYPVVKKNDSGEYTVSHYSGYFNSGERHTYLKEMADHDAVETAIDAIVAAFEGMNAAIAAFTK